MTTSFARLKRIRDRWKEDSLDQVNTAEGLYINLPRFGLQTNIFNEHLLPVALRTLSRPEVIWHEEKRHIKITGRTTIGAVCSVTMHVFILEDQPDAAIHCIASLSGELFEKWHPATAIRGIYPPSWLHDFTLKAATCCVSTLDGDRTSLEELLGKQVGGFAIATLRRGVNFRGSAALPFCDTIERLRTFAAEDERFDQDAPSEPPSLKAIIADWTTPRLICGHIGERDGLASLSIDVMATMRWQPFVDNSLAITVETLTLSASRLNDREAAPVLAFAISGQITLPAHEPANHSESPATVPTTHAPTYAYRLGIDSSGQALRLEADLVMRPDGSWLSGLRIPGLSDVIPAGVIPTVKTLGLRLPFKKDRLKTLRLSLAWDKWVLVGDEHSDTSVLITMQPTVHIVTGFATNNTQIRLDAKLQFRDNGAFDLAASYPSGDFAATLSSDTPLNFQRAFGGLLSRLTPDPEKFSITVLDLEGNLPRRDFTFHAVACGELNFAIAETALTLSHIDFSVSHAASAWEGRLSARLTIAKIPFELSAALTSGSCHFACVVSSVTVKDLASDLLGIAAPEALRDVVLKDFCLDFSLGEENILHLSAESEGEIAIGGLRIGIDRLALGYDKTRGGLFFEGDAHLRYASPLGRDARSETLASLSVSYEDRRGLIQGAVTGLHLNLADMISALSHELGLSVKLEGTAAISDVHVLYEFGEGPQRFAMHLKLNWTKNDADGDAHWYFIAQKLTDGVWRSIMYMTLPPLDFYALPYVGEALRGVTNALDRAAASTQPPPSPPSGNVKPVIGLDHIAFGIASKMDSTAVASAVSGIDFAAGFGEIDMSSGYSLSADIALPNARRSIVFPRRTTTPQEDATTSAAAAKPTTRDSVPTSPSPTHGANNAANRQTTHSATATADTAAGTSAGAPSCVADSSAVVGRAFGPVTIARINASASKAGLRVDIDATAKLGPIEMSLIGLRADSPLSWPPAPQFDLEGLSVACTTDTLTLAGGLQKKSGVNSYAGQLVVKFGKFSLTAIALYDEQPHPSFAVFLAFCGPIGGPPAFFITGLAGGVGHHRALPSPRIDDVASHVFIKAISGGADTDALAQLEKASPATLDQHWIAFGIRFSSFNLIDSVAILTLSLGSATRVNLLGRSTLELPPVSPVKAGAKKLAPVARIELALLADLQPSAGEFVLLGQLTSRSFLFDPEARLGGGFAFALWFGNHPHAGDFVLTVGGYHPRFVVPAHYPKVAPISLNWQVTPQLSIKGERYFAVTPSALMLGGTLSITWQSNSIRAWLDFESHFLIHFQPFAFEAVVQVSVGVAVSLQTWLGTYAFSLTVGASLVVSGPPFHGVCRISAAGVSFEIAFGEQGSPTPRVIDWRTLRRTLLPAANRREHNALANPQLTTVQMFGATPGVTTDTDSLIVMTVVSGLLDSTTRSGAPRSEHADLPVWRVSSAELVVEIACAVPLSSMALDGEPALNITANAFGVKPMGLAAGALRSDLRVKYEGSASWDIRPLHSNVPTGLWGDPTSDALGASMVPEVLIGMALRPQRHQGATTSKPVALEKDPQPINASIDASTRKAQWVRTTSPVITSPADAIARMQSSCHATEVCQARMDLIAALNTLASDTGESTMMLQNKGRAAIARRPFDIPEQLAHFAQALPTLLSDAPKFVSWAPSPSSSSLP